MQEFAFDIDISFTEFKISIGILFILSHKKYVCKWIYIISKTLTYTNL